MLLKRIGPGLITASVVLGPGSIVASSRAGADAGYALAWALLAAGLLMGAYTAMGARLGCSLADSPLRYLATHAGRPWAAAAGLASFFVTTGFQFGNNLGVAYAMSGLVASPLWIWPAVFTLASLIFLFAAKEVYKFLERLMMALVALMILSFSVNLLITGVDLSALVRGLAPWPIPHGNNALLASAMIATNFSVVAALYQAYLVKEKGWRRENIQQAIYDAWTGIAILAAIALIILVGAAQTLHGSGAALNNVGDLAKQLAGILGPGANVVFCLGLGAASFSSFIVNAVIGGNLLADGLGLDARLASIQTKALAAIAMVTGCVIAVITVTSGKGGTTSIIIAQASTLIAAPAAAILVYYLSSRKHIMGELKNGPALLILGALGLAVIMFLFGRTAYTLWGQLG